MNEPIIKNIFLAIAVTFVAILSVTSCKPSEENYRRAYERTISAASDSTRTEFGQTIYARYRQQTRNKVVISGEDTIQTVVVNVTFAKEGGGIPEQMKQYCVVAGEFKQLFNAKSLCERLRDGGFPGAFLVQTPEPYYYVVALSVDNIPAAVAGMKSLHENTPVRLKAPAPYILQPARLAR